MTATRRKTAPGLLSADDDSPRKDRVRLEAATFLADRAWGKPVQVNHLRTTEDFHKVCGLFGKKVHEVLGAEAFAKVAEAIKAIPLAEFEALGEDDA